MTTSQQHALAVSTAERQAERIEAQIDELVRMLAAVGDEHWRRRPGPDGWSAAETCGHIAELLPYWAGQARAVAASPGLRFGRPEEDEARVEAIARGALRDRHDAVERLRAAEAEACAAIHALPDDAWELSGVHLLRGPMTVAAIIDTLVAGHLESHVAQVSRALL